MTSRPLFLSVVFALSYAALGSSLACSGRSSGTVCRMGEERCACYPNDTCNGALACRSQVCVSITGHGGQSGALGGGSADTGTADNVDAGDGAGGVGITSDGGVGVADAPVNSAGAAADAGGGAGPGIGTATGGSGGMAGSAAGRDGGAGADAGGTGGGTGGGGGGGPSTAGLLTDAVAVTGAGSTTCALMADKTVRCWGNGDNGQIGDGASTTRRYPTAVSGLSNVKAIAGRALTFCAVRTDGTVACWGGNVGGQVGNGNTANQPRPVPVAGLTGVVGVGVGAAFACALLGDGTARCWGSNDNGEFGDADPRPRLTPVPIPNLTGATSIAVGDYHACAVITGGGLACWGANGVGQLGTGTTSDHSTPVMAVVTDVAEISAGHDFTCARTAGGTVRCWGQALALGDPKQTDPKQPSSTGLANIAAITAGSQHACAVNATGRVSCWGDDGVGSLGDGGAFPGRAPVPVRGGAGVLAIGSGDRHSCVVIGDHTVRCWGSNEFGALGDGNTTDAPQPVAVRLDSGASAPTGPIYGPNLIPNGDFSAGQTGWQTTMVSNGFAQVTAGAFCFSYGDPGAGTLGTTGPLAITAGVVYEFGFRAWTTIDTSQNIVRVLAKVGEAGPPYTDYTTLMPALSATRAGFSKVFTMAGDVTAGLAFITSASYRGSTCFDDIVVRAVQYPW